MVRSSLDLTQRRGRTLQRAGKSRCAPNCRRTLKYPAARALGGVLFATGCQGRLTGTLTEIVCSAMLPAISVPSTSTV